MFFKKKAYFRRPSRGFSNNIVLDGIKMGYVVNKCQRWGIFSILLRICLLSSDIWQSSPSFTKLFSEWRFSTFSASLAFFKFIKYADIYYITQLHQFFELEAQQKCNGNLNNLFITPLNPNCNLLPRFLWA